MFIIIRILEILWSRGGTIKKTNLQMASNLNFDIFSKYINWLEKWSLIEISNQQKRLKVIRITPKGIKAYKRIIIWIKDFIDDVY